MYFNHANDKCEIRIIWLQLNPNYLRKKFDVADMNKNIFPSLDKNKIPRRIWSQNLGIQNEVSQAI